MEYRAWYWDEHSQAGVIDAAVRVIMDGAVNVIHTSYLSFFFTRANNIFVGFVTNMRYDVIMDGAVNVMGGAVNVGQMILLMPIVAICVNSVVLESKKISYQGQSFL